jgi:hypothetical protein
MFKQNFHINFFASFCLLRFQLFVSLLSRKFNKCFRFANFPFGLVSLPYFSFRFVSLPYFSFRFASLPYFSFCFVSLPYFSFSLKAKKIEAVFPSFRCKIFLLAYFAFFASLFHFVSPRFIYFSFRL